MSFRIRPCYLNYYTQLNIKTQPPIDKNINSSQSSNQSSNPSNQPNAPARSFSISKTRASVTDCL